MIFNIVFLSVATVWTFAFAHKFRQLRAHHGSPRLLVMCAAVFFPAVATWLAVPATQQVINRVTGWPNVSILLVASHFTAISASWLTLGLFVRHSADMAWKWARWVIAAYALDIVAMAVLFSLSNVPVERVHNDFAVTYVPHQLTVFAFYMVYLLPAAAGTLILAYWCLTWAKMDDYAQFPRLRRRLRLLGLAGASLNVYMVLMVVNVIAVRFDLYDSGPQIKALALTVPTVSALSLFSAAVGTSSLRAWLSRWRDFFTLRYLHRALRPVSPGSVMVINRQRLDPYHRVRRIVIELNDWRLILKPLFDPAVYGAADRWGRESGLTGERLTAAVEAAQLRAALRAWQRGERPLEGAEAHPDDEQILDASSIEAEVDWWLRVARAYKRATERSSLSGGVIRPHRPVPLSSGEEGRR
ncbi:MAB_1171c family putative transporter [Streptomyces sp. 8N616]|uniref:MAB_1171c family putative transporter n=1 Tax=Streptomyces sp. 8N616 TaxID=3457414 RepID=UPI003FCF1E11